MRAIFATAMVLVLVVVLDAKAQEDFKLPEGVVHIRLSPGEMRMQRILKDGRPLIRVTVGKTIVEAHTLFLGDGRWAITLEAHKDGIHWVPAEGGKGLVQDGIYIYDPGFTIADLGHIFSTVDKLKPGNVYLTTPSIKFGFGPPAKR